LRSRADVTGFGAAPPAPRRAEASTPGPGGAGAGTARRSGWLSDLLTRASREDAEPRDNGGDDRPARHTVESLDSLAVDIARMIDHDAATELWDRHKRGERQVFTGTLYTMQGQRAFDEICRKAEFERLLDEVSRDDRGQAAARTYLTSETGKVYTMLAHAAGRFD
jgi:hypothetical protein